MIDGLRPSDPIWKTFKLFQIAPISKYGLGKSICFEFLAATFKKKLMKGQDQYSLWYYGEANYNYKIFNQEGLTEEQLMS